MILVDSSAWVEYDRVTGTPVDVTLARLIREGGAFVVTEPVVMEVCVGARSPERERELRRLLDRFPLPDRRGPPPSSENRFSDVGGQV